MMRSANPVLREGTFGNYGRIVNDQTFGMTLSGTVNKTGILLLLLMLSAGWVWNQMAAGGYNSGVTGLVIAGSLLGFVLALVTVFKQSWSPITAPLYAVAQGLFLGGISSVFEMRYPGIVIQAVGLTFGTLAALLLAYTSGVIRATENFKLGVFAATGGIGLLFIVNMVMGFFGMQMSFIHGSGPMGILFSLFVVVIAALNLVMDFDFIEQGAANGAPKYMEWYGAFGLIVTLIWLYLEILRLLGKTRSQK